VRADSMIINLGRSVRPADNVPVNDGCRTDKE
jgi:hypothetical protein